MALGLILLGRRHGYGIPDYLQFLVDGLQAGAIYALVALGFVVVHRVTGIINFAQGAFVMLGPMLTITLYGLDWPLPPAGRLAAAAVLAVSLTTAVGVAVHRLAVYPARDAPLVTKIIITVGAYLVLQGVALLAWGPRPYVLPAFSTLEMADHVFLAGGVLVRAQSLWIWGTTAATLALLALFFGLTLLGKAMRACAANRLAARLAGIPVDVMATLAFALGAALGAIAGIVVGPITRPTFEMGLEIGLKGFVAAVMGGLVSFPGAVLGGLILGILETFWAGVTMAGFKDLFAFVVLIVLLIARPHGFAGAEEEGEGR
jgi:branched-chain amino acid transport system permease protein